MPDHPALGVSLDDGFIERLVHTRDALHAVVEHVVAPVRHAHDGHIGLRVLPGGAIGTPAFPTPDGPTVIRLVLTAGEPGSVDGAPVEIVVDVSGRERRAAVTTVAAAADLLGFEPGAPTAVYTPTTALVPDRALVLDPAAAGYLFDFFGAADAALRALAGQIVDEDPTEIQLWPEHFDLGFSASEVNYGASPGDENHRVPYLYVGPWSPPAGAFWNEAFGASRPVTEMGGAEFVAFLREGHDLAGG